MVIYSLREKFRANSCCLLVDLKLLLFEKQNKTLLFYFSQFYCSIFKSNSSQYIMVYMVTLFVLLCFACKRCSSG